MTEEQLSQANELMDRIRLLRPVVKALGESVDNHRQIQSLIIAAMPDPIDVDMFDDTTQSQMRNALWSGPAHELDQLEKRFADL